MNARPRITDEDLLDAVREAELAGETDALDGGVALPAINERVDAEESWVYRRVKSLVAEDQLESVWGANPENGRARESYRLYSEG